MLQRSDTETEEAKRWRAVCALDLLLMHPLPLVSSFHRPLQHFSIRCGEGGAPGVNTAEAPPVDGFDHSFTGHRPETHAITTMTLGRCVCICFT